jgi:ATP-dependent DNA ligase
LRIGKWGARVTGFRHLEVRPPLPPMEAKRVESLPEEAGWQFEPKWDGFRCLVFRDGDAVELQSKAERTLARYFPEMVAAVLALPEQRLVLDGELVIPAGKALSFDALQLRLHPAASRIAKLAAETPARLMLFDCLEIGGKVLIEAPLAERRAALEGVRLPRRDIRLSRKTTHRRTASRWLADGKGALDGVICKRLDEPYRPGERAMLKVKRLRSADCVVGGFRYGEGSRIAGSLLLGLYDDDGRLNHVGFTSAFPDPEGLTPKLEALVAPPGFDGRAPGGPSRWSTGRSAEWRPLRPELVAEVRFDQVTGGRFRHGTRFLRWRPDKAPRQCRMDQLGPGSG